MSPQWFFEKYGVRSGGSNYLELSPRSLCCGCAIGSDGSEIRRQMKKLSRRESWEIKEKIKKNENNDVDGSGNRSENEGNACIY